MMVAGNRDSLLAHRQPDAEQSRHPKHYAYLLRRGGVDDAPHYLHGIRREAAQLCVFAHRLFGVGDVDAVDLVVRDKGFQPLYLGPNFANDRAGLLRNSAQLLRSKLSRAGNISFNNEFRYLVLSLLDSDGAMIQHASEVNFAQLQRRIFASA
jgi:hypothetical protein